MFSFNARDPRSVTSLAFDHENSRLLVGCNSGVIRLFNYGNGQLLKQYSLASAPDISNMCSVVEGGVTVVYAATESAEMYLWEDTAQHTNQEPIKHARLNTSAHDLDISGLVHVAPDLLVTCSFDGKLVIWASGVPRQSFKDPKCEQRPAMMRGMLKLCFLPLQKKAKTPSSTFSRRRSDMYDLEKLLKFHILVAAGTDGHLYFWNLCSTDMPTYLFEMPVFPKTKGSFGIVQVSNRIACMALQKAKLRASYTVLQMCADHTHSFLSCGNAHGVVKVYDISQVRNHKKSLNALQTDGNERVDSMPSPTDGQLFQPRRLGNVKGELRDPAARVSSA